MVEWGTESWFEEVIKSSRRFDPTPGADVKSLYVITGAPSGDVRYVEEIKDGRVVRLTYDTGELIDVTVTVPYPDFKRLFKEGLTSDQLKSRKVEGDVSKIERLLPIRRTERFQEHTKHLRSITVWPDDST